MKKKVLIVMILSLVLVACLTAFVACNGTGRNTSLFDIRRIQRNVFVGGAHRL